MVIMYVIQILMSILFHLGKLAKMHLDHKEPNCGFKGRKHFIQSNVGNFPSVNANSYGLCSEKDNSLKFVSEFWFNFYLLLLV